MEWEFKCLIYDYLSVLIFNYICLFPIFSLPFFCFFSVYGLFLMVSVVNAAFFYFYYSCVYYFFFFASFANQMASFRFRCIPYILFYNRKDNLVDLSIPVLFDWHDKV